MFSRQALQNLIIPMFLEQLLVAFVGIADVFIIGFVSEAAVSGVSLVNSFNSIFLYLFIALASGGAVVISQYIGKKDFDKAGEAGSQLLLFAVFFGIYLHLGVKGIAYAMCLDWTVRGIIFWLRFKSGIWKNFKVIE